MVESGAHQISCVLSRHDPSYSCRTKLLLELRGTLQSHPHMIWHEILRVCGVLGIVGVHLELWKHKCTKGSTTELYPCTFSCYLMCSAFFPCLTSTYQVLLHEEIVEITLFQHTPCRYLPISFIDRHPIWPPQPVHSHRLLRAIARQISSANIPKQPTVSCLPMSLSSFQCCICKKHYDSNRAVTWSAIHHFHAAAFLFREAHPARQVLSGL